MTKRALAIALAVAAVQFFIFWVVIRIEIDKAAVAALPNFLVTLWALRHSAETNRHLRQIAQAQTERNQLELERNQLAAGQDSLDTGVLSALQQHCGRPGAPIFTAENLRDSFFQNRSAREVFQSLKRLECEGSVRQLDIGTMDSGPQIGWIVTDFRSREVGQV